MSFPSPVGSPDSLKLPVNPDKSPSENYEFLPHTMPHEHAPSPSPPIMFGQSTLTQPKMNSSNSQTPGFSSKPWIVKKELEESGKVVIRFPSAEYVSPHILTAQPPNTQLPQPPITRSSPVEASNTLPMTIQSSPARAPSAQPVSNEIVVAKFPTAKLSIPELPSSQGSLTKFLEECAAKCTPPRRHPHPIPRYSLDKEPLVSGTIQKMDAQADAARTGLLQDQEFLTLLGRNLLQDKSFIHNLVSKVGQGLQEDVNLIRGSLTQRYVAASKPLISLCLSNGLPEPHIHSTSTMDGDDNVEFEVEIRLGMQGKSLFRSQKCRTLEEALAQANSRAIQMMEDLGLSVTADSTLAEGNTPPRRPEGARNHSSDQTSGSMKHLNHKSPYMNTRFSAVKPHVERSVRALSPPATSRTPNRKRQISKISSDHVETPQINMPALMARLYNIPAADGEARVSIICDYFNVREPILKKKGSGTETVYRARFSNGRFGHIGAQGLTSALMFRQLEQKLMKSLEAAKIEGRTEDHNVTKRRRSRPTDCLDYITVEDDVVQRSKEDSEELFSVDLTGDEGLAVSKQRHKE